MTLGVKISFCAHYTSRQATVIYYFACQATIFTFLRVTIFLHHKQAHWVEIISFTIHFFLCGSNWSVVNFIPFYNDFQVGKGSYIFMGPEKKCTMKHIAEM